MTSSPTRPTRATSSRGSSRECCACRACRATSPFSLPRTRLPDWPAGGLLRCIAARLSVCRVVLQIPRSRHALLVAGILARMSRGSTRKLLPWNLSYSFVKDNHTYTHTHTHTHKHTHNWRILPLRLTANLIYTVSCIFHISCQDVTQLSFHQTVA